MDNGLLIKNGILIVVILTAVFYSQQTHFKEVGPQIMAHVDIYWQKGNDWFKTNIYPKVSSEVEKRGGELTKGINTQKNNILQSTWESIKNYLAQKFSKTFGTEVK